MFRIKVLLRGTLSIWLKLELFIILLGLLSLEILQRSPEAGLSLDDSEFKKSTHITAELKRRQNIKVIIYLQVSCDVALLCVHFVR